MQHIEKSKHAIYLNGSQLQTVNTAIANIKDTNVDTIGKLLVYLCANYVSNNNENINKTIEFDSLQIEHQNLTLAFQDVTKKHANLVELATEQEEIIEGLQKSNTELERGLQIANTTIEKFKQDSKQVVKHDSTIIDTNKKDSNSRSIIWWKNL